MPEFKDLTKFLLILAEKAGEILLSYYSPAGVPYGEKSDSSRITEADTKINHLVIEEVKKNYPEFKVLGEEESNNTAESKKLFVVDPIDGTLNFTMGSPLFCFSAAVVIDGKSVAGVILNPLAKRTLLAEEGKGAWLIEEGKRISVSQKNNFDMALINCGYKETEFSALVHSKGARTPSLFAVCEYGSMVAIGGFEAALYLSHFPHDIAALKIIVEEAGGKVTDINGGEQRYDMPIRGALISNRILHAELLKLVQESGVKNKIKAFKS